MRIILALSYLVLGFGTAYANMAPVDLPIPPTKPHSTFEKCRHGVKHCRDTHFYPKHRS
jgi:hypothetical protein